MELYPYISRGMYEAYPRKTGRQVTCKTSLVVSCSMGFLLVKRLVQGHAHIRTHARQQRKLHESNNTDSGAIR